MSITVKRNTGWIDCATRVQIKVNAEKTVKVKHNQHILIDGFHLGVIEREQKL